MSFSIVKSLLVALVAGASVQALAINQSSESSASQSASSDISSSGSGFSSKQSSESNASQSASSDISGPGFSSKQSSESNASQSASSDISISGSGFNSKQSSESKASHSASSSFESSGPGATHIGSSGLRSVGSIGFNSQIAAASASNFIHSTGSVGSLINFESTSSYLHSQKIASSLLSAYNVKVEDFSNVFYQVINSASDSLVIDLGLFKSLFGSNLKVCIPQIEKLIKEYLAKIGLKKTITFQVPTIKVQPSAEEITFAEYLSEIKKKVTIVQDTKPTTILAILNEPKAKFSSCSSCLNELNLIESNVVNFAQSSQSLSSFQAQSASFLAAQQQSFSQSYSHFSSSSSASSSSFSL